MEISGMQWEAEKFSSTIGNVHLDPTHSFSSGLIFVLVGGCQTNVDAFVLSKQILASVILETGDHLCLLYVINEAYWKWQFLPCNCTEISHSFSDSCLCSPQHCSPYSSMVP